MPKQLYNEGRVVGYSAYEIYVKEALAHDPNTPPGSEREWMATMLTDGSAMLLKVVTDNISGPHYRDIPLPASNRMCAASTIIANFFTGTATWSGVWATSITSYDALLNPPPGMGDPAVILDWPKNNRAQLQEYMKIVDGLVIQPGRWQSATVGTPDLTKVPKVRLFLDDKIDTEFYVLLTGFSMRSIVQGAVKLDGSDEPQDGDFLGPSSFPWANKIVFSVPASFVNYFLANNYNRTFQSEEITVQTTPVIDMDTANSGPGHYYNNWGSAFDRDANGKLTWDPTKLVKYIGSSSPLRVNDINDYREGEAMIMTWRRGMYVSTGLYGVKVTSTGATNTYPIDTYAPSTVKVIVKNEPNWRQKANDRIKIPGNHVLLYDPLDGTLNYYQGDEYEDINKTAQVTMHTIPGTSGYSVMTQTGTSKAHSISISDLVNNIYPMSSPPVGILGHGGSTAPAIGVPNQPTSHGFVFWRQLMDALVGDDKIDILGPGLRAAQVALSDFQRFQDDMDAVSRRDEDGNPIERFGTASYMLRFDVLDGFDDAGELVPWIQASLVRV